MQMLVQLIAIAILCLLANGVWFQPRLRREARNRRKRPFMALEAVFTAEFTTPNITLTFSVPVVLSGIPQFETNTGKLPISATLATLNTVLLVYDTPGAVTDVTVPQNDPAIRTATGGYCPSGTFPAT